MDDMIDEAAMLREFDVYRTGVRFDGTPVLSRDPKPASDDTVVWMADRPDEEMTVVELEDLTDVSWLGEPEPWDPEKAPQARQAAAVVEVPDLSDLDLVDDEGPYSEDETDDEAVVAAADMPEPGEPDQPSEAEVHEMTQVVEEAERRTGELEAVIAQAMLPSVTNHLFDDDPSAAITASAPVIITGASSLKPLMARLAALPSDLPADLAARVEALQVRLDALEAQIAKLAIDQVEDLEMPAPSEDYVDETLDDKD